MKSQQQDQKKKPNLTGGGYEIIADKILKKLYERKIKKNVGNKR